MGTLSNYDKSLNLYNPERQQRRDLWQFIDLVAPTNEKKQWKSKEAIAAYCKRCEKTINYTPGTSKQVLRHMEQYHPEDLESTTSIKKKRKYEKPTPMKARKKIMPIHDSISESGNRLLLNWIIESYRPLEIVEDQGFIKFCHFLNSLNEKYTPPSSTIMASMLRSVYDDTLATIKTSIQNECDFYTLTSNIWTSGIGKTYISLIAHYITKDFKRKAITLRCAPFSDARQNEVELARMIEDTTTDMGLSVHNMIVYVSDNGNQTARYIGMNHQLCVAQSLNLIVQKFIRQNNDISEDTLNTTSMNLMKILKAIDKLREYANYFNTRSIGSNWLNNSMETVYTIPKIIPLDVSTHWTTTVQMLKIGLEIRNHLDEFSAYIQTSGGRNLFPNCSKIIPITSEEWFILENVCSLLAKFEEATEALLGEKYPTWSLTLPILRMIQIHLIEFKAPTDCSHTSWFHDAFNTIETLHQMLLHEFRNMFERTHMSLLWIILLDPRLIAMNGFSSDERESARVELLEQMKNTPDAIRQSTQNENIRNTADSEYISPLLSSIFASNHIVTYERDNNNETDEMELNRYYQLCKQSAISNPLQWWNLNRKAFPVLAWLSRKWVCAVSTSAPSGHLFSGTKDSAAPRCSRLNDDNIEMLTFVHDNVKYTS